MRPARAIAHAAISLAALLLAGCDGADSPDTASEPPLETPLAKLESALDCTPFTHPDKPAVLLVHGTFTHGQEQYNWSYRPLLMARGYDVCTVTYPDRGLATCRSRPNTWCTRCAECAR